MYICFSLPANIPPPYFIPFGTNNGDTKIDISAMATSSGSDVDHVDKTLSPAFRVHAYNYSAIRVCL